MKLLVYNDKKKKAARKNTNRLIYNLKCISVFWGKVIFMVVNKMQHFETYFHCIRP